MNLKGLSTQDCILKLQKLSADIDKICSLFDSKGSVNRENVELARGLLHGLKELLRTEYESRDKVSTHQNMSSVERDFYFPAIHEAYTRIHVKSNSIPSGKWHMELLDAQSSLKYYLLDLLKMADSAA
jgi:hypothetical protein